VFAHHREALTTLEKILAPWQPAVLHGGTERRDEQIDRFQNDPACMVFIGQLQAAGSSINLQAAERVLFVEASWTPGDNDQAYSRVYRAGQTKPVLVRFLYLPGSIDEAVMRALARKSAMISQVIN
jgi:SWI/SNF-related matrix-associated actin-dependent regulator of chromatin subfamily A-like protein 1